MTQTAPTRAIVLGIYRTAHCQKMLNKCIHAATRPERTKRPDMTIKRTMQRTSPGLADWLGVVRTGFNPSVFSDMLCWLLLITMQLAFGQNVICGLFVRTKQLQKPDLSDILLRHGSFMPCLNGLIHFSPVGGETG